MLHFPPKISVIVPAFNCGNFIEDTIQNLLNQNYPSLEIICIDDGSTDKTAEKIKKYVQIHYLHQDNNGPASARNLGLSIATGEYILFLDCDDFLENNSLHLLSNYLQNNKEVQIVDGKIIDFHKNVKTNKPEYENQSYYMCNLGSCLIRKEVIEIIGDFNEQLRWGEDLDWYTRAWENNIKKVRIDQLILHYQKHTKSLTYQLRNDTVNYRLQLFKLKLERAKNRTHIPEGILIDYIGQK